jgi:hypothetical protein
MLTMNLDGRCLHHWQLGCCFLSARSWASCLCPSGRTGTPCGDAAYSMINYPFVFNAQDRPTGWGGREMILLVGSAARRRVQG